MQWHPGYELPNHPYQIEQVLGIGGFGITYQAKHLDLDLTVLIKTPNSRRVGESSYDKYIHDFDREAKQLAKLGSNPYLVKIRDVFETENLPCLVMDFVPGESLSNFVTSKGILSESTAIQFICQIGSAVTLCHQKGIIHRDIHPHNILLRADNQNAVLIDFGIAEHTQTDRNTYSGNPIFSPWEQLAFWEQQNSQTPQVDIYALAASLYFSVTKQQPTPSLARKYNNASLIAPIQLNPKISNELNNLIVRGMALEPRDRPVSVVEWLDFLPVATTIVNPISSLSIDPTKADETAKARSLAHSVKKVQKQLVETNPSLFSPITTDIDSENELSELITDFLKLSKSENTESQAIKDNFMARKIFDYNDGCFFMEVEEYIVVNKLIDDIFLVQIVSGIAVTPFDEYIPEPDLLSGCKAIERFKKIELDCSNLLPINNCRFGKNGRLFVINSIQSDCTIQELVERNGKLPVQQAVDITLQILDGLHYAHNEKQIFHGDLRLNNILLTIAKEGDCVVKIAHSGIMNYLRKNSDVTRILVRSVFHFMLLPPGLGCHEPWVDVYSTAIILYYMLTGNVPVDIDSPNPADTDSFKPVPIRQRNNSISQPLAELIDWALADKNFKNAKAFQNALRTTISK